MESAALVALANKAAARAIGDPHVPYYVAGEYGEIYLHVFTGGELRFDTLNHPGLWAGLRPKDAILRARVTVESVACEEALARELLSSAGLCLCGETLTVDGHNCKTAGVA